MEKRSKNIQTFEQHTSELNISDVSENVLSQPFDAKSYQGTIVKVLPNSDYYKKYWNKKHYLERKLNNINGKEIYYLKESYDGISGWYGSVFCTNAIEHIHFEYIKGNPIYNNIGDEIGKV